MKVTLNDTAYFAPYSKAMRDKVSKYGVYVDCTGGIRTSKTPERLLAEQVCDLVGIADLWLQINHFCTPTFSQ